MNIMANWIKTTPYGDYKDPLQNHKFDDQLVFNSKTLKLEVYNKIKNILHEAKWYYGKHIGSKKLGNIIALNRKVNDKRHLIKDYVKSKTQKPEESSEDTGK